MHSRALPCSHKSIRQHPSAYVSIRQQTADKGGTLLAQKHTSASVSIHQHPSAYGRQGWHLARTKAYARIHQHTSAYDKGPPCSHKTAKSPSQRCKLEASHSSMLLSLRHASASAYISIRQHTSAYISIRQQHAVATPPRLRLCIRQQMSAYVSIRHHTSAHISTMLLPLRPASASAYVSRCQHTSAYVSIAQQHAVATPPRLRLCIRQQMSADVSIRQHTSA